MARTDLYLSPADLAEALGLSASTLKRWTDKGVLKVERTVGGHRRIAMTEAVRFVRESGLKAVMPQRLGLIEPGNAADAADPAGRVARLLEEGRADEARRVLVSAFAAGEDISTIGDQWIRPAFERLGELWRHGDDGIAVEHQATDAVLRAVAEMRALVLPRDDARLAVGGAASQDPYALPSALVGLTLAANGFKTINLGPDLPPDALLAFVDRVRPRLVWISVSVAQAESASRAHLEDISRRLVAKGPAVVVGGRSCPERVKHATVCRDLASLSVFARGMLA